MKLILLLILLFCGPAFAEQPLADPAAEARAVALGDQLRCMVCQSETINDSGAEMAQDMRRLIREKIVAGWADRQIIDYIHARYGDYILLNPPFQANTWLLWAAPALLLAAAGAGVIAAFRRCKRVDQ